MRPLLIALAAAIVLSACTYQYTRQYEVDPAQNMSLLEQQQVFQAFRDFLSAKGLRTFGPTDPNSIAYEISGSIASTRGGDMLELSYASGDGFRLQLVRITGYPGDFSADYLKDFVEKTETFIQQATSKPVRIRIVQGGRT